MYSYIIAQLNIKYAYFFFLITSIDKDFFSYMLEARVYITNLWKSDINMTSRIRRVLLEQGSKEKSLIYHDGQPRNCLKCPNIANPPFRPLATVFNNLHHVCTLRHASIIGYDIYLRNKTKISCEVFRSIKCFN